MRRLSPWSIRFLALFAYSLWRILSAIFWRNSCCVLFVLCVFIFLVLLLFLRVLVLFVSPRSPSRAHSKNALSFFLRDLISRASSSSDSDSAGGSSSSSAPSSSAFRAHSVRGVAASWAFSRNASLSSILEAATWSFSSVFTSFYLKDVQFSSSSGFSLGPVVAADSVV